MIGTYSAKVDDKGRLFVPARLREELGDVFYVTVGVRKDRSRCLTIYTKTGWDELQAKFDALPLSKKDSLSAFFANAVECRPDKQYRFSTSARLFQFAGIEKDVTFVGQGSRAEIWDMNKYEEISRAEMLPENLLMGLESEGL